mgnify:CR=1 FL=1
MKEEKTILFQDNFIHNSIKDAFLQLLMKKDYMQITITDLCKYAGVSRGTFYAHFGNIGRWLMNCFQMHYVILKIWRCYQKMHRIQIQRRGFVGFFERIQNISRFFSQKRCFFKL